MDHAHWATRTQVSVISVFHSTPLEQRRSNTEFWLLFHFIPWGNISLIVCFQCLENVSKTFSCFQAFAN